MGSLFSMNQMKPLIVLSDETRKAEKTPLKTKKAESNCNSPVPEANFDKKKTSPKTGL